MRKGAGRLVKISRKEYLQDVRKEDERLNSRLKQAEAPLTRRVRRTRILFQSNQGTELHFGYDNE